MPTTCCAPGCKERHSKFSHVRFFRLPRDEERRKKWIISMKRTKAGDPNRLWEPSYHERICSLHFISGEPSTDVNHPDFLPTIFNIKSTPRRGRAVKRRGRPRVSQSTQPCPSPQRQATAPLPTSSGSNMDDENLLPARLKIKSQRLEENMERYNRKRRKPGSCDYPEQQQESNMEHCSDFLKLVVIEEQLLPYEPNQSPAPDCGDQKSPQIKEEQADQNLLQIKEEQEDQKILQIKEEQEDQKLFQIKEEQEDQKLLQIKDEQEDTEILQFTLDPVSVKTEDNEENPHLPNLLHSQPVENRDFVGTDQCLKSDDEDKTCNSSSETDVSDGNWEESEARPATAPFNAFKSRWPNANRGNQTMASSPGLMKHKTALSAKDCDTYFKKLTLTNGKQLPDPWKITKWKDDMRKWPHIQWYDIYTYLVDKTGMYTREKLRAYKYLDAYRYMTGGHLKEVTYHDLDSEFCVLKSEIHPTKSKLLKATKYKAWVIINKADNNILTADCTCMAGLGSCCNHVAAILFKIELCVRMGETSKAEVASGVCTLKDSSKEVKPAPLREISFHRSKRLNRRLPGTLKIGPNRVALRVLTLDDILELHAVDPDAAVLTSLESSDTDTASSCGEDDDSDDD